MTTEPIRRFYESVSVAEDGAGIMLDQRRLRTPRGAPFVSPTSALAHTVAAEWDAQVEHILPARMPVTQLAFAAVDANSGRRDELVAHIAKYVETDLLCHRAESPEALVERQDAVWEPIVSWARAHLGAAPPVVRGIIAAPVDPAFTRDISDRARGLDDFRLTGLAHGVGISGSTLIGLALMEGALSPEKAFEAAALDDLWSLERWGEDAEARTRLDRLRADFAALGRFFEALR